MSSQPDDSRRPVERRFALVAWGTEPPLVDEVEFTPWAEPGWSSWNRMSPELQFCEFVASLVRLVQPALTLETGTGQGFLTRRIVPILGEGQRLLCFEQDPGWREALASLPFFEATNAELSEDPTPSAGDFAAAQLSILDSGHPGRSAEVEAWWGCAQSGAVVVVHDVSDRHPPHSGHAKMAQLVSDLAIPGVRLQNPRGGFVGFKP